MTTLANSDLRFKINFHKDTKKFDFRDIFDEAGWEFYLPAPLTHAYVKGLVKGVSPSLTTFYGGTAYNNNDFTTPEIDGSTDTWNKDTLALPATLTSGNYTFYYKAQVQIGLGSGVVLPAFSKANDVFTVTGIDFVTDLLGTLPTGVKLQVISATPGRSAVYDILSAAFSTDTTITISSGGVTSYSAGATDKLYLIFETSKAAYYGFSSVTGIITCESDCRNSLVQIEDDTVYTLTRGNNNSTYAPTTTTRAWTVVYPSSVLSNISASANPLIFGAGTAYNAGTNIYTGDYAVSLSTTLQYLLDTWTDHLGVAYYWFILDDVQSFSTTHTVTCSDCLCNLYDCLVSLDARITANVGNIRIYNELKVLQYQIMWALLMYDRAERCAEDTTVWCNLLVSLLNSADCTCSSGSTTTVTEVIPLSTIISGGGSATAVKWTFGTVASGFPVSPVEYDTHVFTTSGTIGGTTITAGDVYQYISSAWTFQVNIIGADGSSALGVLVNNVANASSGAGGVQTLKTYTIPAGTIATDGSYLDIEALFEVNAGITGDLIVEFGTDVPDILNVPISTSTTTYFKLCSRISRVTETSAFVETWYEVAGNPTSRIDFAPQTTGDDFSGTLDINVNRDFSVGSGTDIISKYLRVTTFNL